MALLILTRGICDIHKRECDVKTACGYSESKGCRRWRLVGRAGFSLLELLVAISILAIALVPIAYFYSRTLQAVQVASIRSRALALAQERLDEMRAMPYEELRTNNEPAAADIELNNLDQTADNVYDFTRFMYFYPLPLGFNPYQPQTQGYDNSPGITRVNGDNVGDPTGTGQSIAPHLNLDGYGGSPEYEYEPIGFYMSLLRGGDYRTTDPRTYPVVERPASSSDMFRRGTQEREDLYAIYGRRTIILDVVPDPADDDTDAFPVNSPYDGGANVLDPYPALKGPFNKFQVRSKYGMRGKLVTVQVFWLPGKAPERYLEPDELNMVELKTFIPAATVGGAVGTENDLVASNDYLFISPPPP